MSDIEWTERTWNPVTGCSRVSAGCDHCYAVRQSFRLDRMGKAGYEGLTVLNNAGQRHFNGIVRCHEDRLTVPMKWKKPQMVFVNSMADLFHPEVPFTFVDQVFASMALCPEHRFQILTKRPERMAAYFHSGNCSPNETTLPYRWGKVAHRMAREDALRRFAGARYTEFHQRYHSGQEGRGGLWPLRNVWLGTSIEDQESANERIPHLLNCPAAIRFLSYEPALAGVDLHEAGAMEACTCSCVNPWRTRPCARCGERHGSVSGLDWIIVGGESGPGARRFELEWARSTVEQCRKAGVACFVKQIGSNAWEDGKRLKTKASKGQDPDEWPQDLRIRQMPDPELAAMERAGT